MLSASAPPRDFCPNHHARWLRACKICWCTMKVSWWFKARALSQALGMVLHGIPFLGSASKGFFWDHCHWDWVRGHVRRRTIDVQIHRVIRGWMQQVALFPV